MGCKSFTTQENGLVFSCVCVCNMCSPWPQLTKLNATKSILYHTDVKPEMFNFMQTIIKQHQQQQQKNIGSCPFSSPVTITLR